MSTEQDSVRRLAEIRSALAFDKGNFGVTPVTEAISYLLSLIDSLTAERDHNKSQADYWIADAEAAEAEVKRLREALVGSSGALTALLDLINDNEDWRTSARIHGSWSVQATNARSALETASAALATPPSEEGQS